ncbi:GNAT family N-acetyltransferase [Sphaerisporangium sp. TRM90804]|uniref:GNAT family N-acetyltransferase n=1 Tax=Sphaerisporangium sp. TRM90804 TaxID=3031113 RepID=UPI0024485A74|nr:GNAT family N-acetyltransferase [Sphaerisporangium sp. TRM90804]MDH2424128.1 GNAT family N-acetyltransferase [Sphaerisporangium sp. TRM90804]
MAWRDLRPEGARPGVARAVRSPRESARFGVSVDRVTVADGSPATFGAVREAVRGSAADVVVVRYPAECVRWFAGLRMPGRTALLADSLVYWRRVAGAPPGRAAAARARPGPEPWVAELRDPATLDKLVADVFEEYGSHYLANPLFDPGLALAGYQEWARGCAAEGMCLGVYTEGPAGDGPAPAGFATLEDEGPHTEIVLAGLVAGARGRGVYAHLLAELERRCLAAGVRELVVSTQGYNTRVQRAWARHGFDPVCAFLTVHLVRDGLLPDQTETDEPARSRTT